MKTKQLYKAVQIEVRQVDDSAALLHKHQFFQLIYVLEGCGMHTINNNTYTFSSGDVFLLVPGDQHSFDLTAPPTFCFIDFTQDYFSKNVYQQDAELDLSESFKKLEYIFHNQHDIKGSLIAKPDAEVFRALINQLIFEWNSEPLFYSSVVQNIIYLLLTIIARNISFSLASSSKSINPKNKAHEVISYIKHNIYEKDLLKIENLAKQFNMSVGHLIRYFKLESGCTIKGYIMKYKLEIVVARLKYSDLTISQIAGELDFTDDSHLNKAFKQAFGMTAKQFRSQFLPAG